MAESENRIIIDGKFQTSSQPAVPVTSRGLLYGEGCFETFRSYKGKFLKLDAHLIRLYSGLRFLGIPYPPKFKIEKLYPKLQLLLKENKLLDQNAIIRMQVWRNGGRGYRVAHGRNSPHYSIIASPLKTDLKNCRLATVETSRIPSAAMPACYKFTNGINYISAAKQAKNKEADDALMETTDGWISETTIANIFWKQNENVFTPSEECDILPGTTRNIVLQLLSENFQVKVRQGRYTQSDLKNAESVWICNSVKEIMSVHQIDKIQFKINTPFLKRLKQSFTAYRNEELLTGYNAEVY